MTIATLLRGSAKTIKRNKLEKQNSITEGKECEKLRTFIAALILQIFSVMTFVKWRLINNFIFAHKIKRGTHKKRKLKQGLLPVF